MGSRGAGFIARASRTGSNHMGSRAEYADFLRVIGQVLDAEAAQQIEIIEHETFISISWQSGPGTTENRSFRDLDLTTLRDRARELRGTATADVPHTRAELLRVLGQELDEQDVALNGVIEEKDGYRVSGTAGRRYINRLYSWDDLRDASMRRADQRHGATEMPLQLERVASSGPSRAWWQFWVR
jgi:hypothetical protein